MLSFALPLDVPQGQARRLAARRSVACRRGACRPRGDGAATCQITCSAGIAVAPLDGNDATTLVSIADARLLAAKNAGRDRLMVAG